MSELQSTGFRQFVGQLEGKHFGKEHFLQRILFKTCLTLKKFSFDLLKTNTLYEIQSYGILPQTKGVGLSNMYTRAFFNACFFNLFKSVVFWGKFVMKLSNKYSFLVCIKISNGLYRLRHFVVTTLIKHFFKTLHIVL